MVMVSEQGRAASHRRDAALTYQRRAVSDTFNLNIKASSILVIIINIKIYNLNFMWKRFQIKKTSEGTFESHSQRTLY